MEDRTVIITGGSRGIGLNITEEFVDLGYFVVVGARHDTNLAERFGKKVFFCEIDVRNETEHINLVNKAIALTGRLDVYINNAGFSEWRPIEAIDNIFLENMISTNLKSVFWGCKSAALVMKNGGCIVNISSIAGKRGSTNNSAYVATKFAINGLTQSLAKELGPIGIRVNGICPVLIPTEGLIHALKSEYSPANGDPEKFIARFAEENSALKRLPSGKEIAKTCSFLVSDGASAITGQNINVDCGVFPQ